ncbi:MAG: hypothetical protein JSW27_11195 [Phycisphaerales bacterium]|nr:MAG: hypothetical protein JSW27_11195 [Phycisphaerales bacterium]
MNRAIGAALRTVMAVTFVLPITVTPAGAQDEPAKKWTFDVSLYGLAAGMSGDMTVRGVDADLDVGFDDIWDNLEFGAMGKVRIGYNRWAFNTEVIYMALAASKSGVDAELDQWIVEPALSYKVCREFEPLVGVRYNNISGEIKGPGVLPTPRIPTGTQDWWDPIVGADFHLPLAAKWSLNLRGDIGGFGAGSDLTWQAFPYVSWQFAKRGSLQAGYRWLYTDYETGSGADEFRYDVLSQGLQLGLTLNF